MVRALLVANERLGAAGYVGDELEQQGFAFERALRERPEAWPDLHEVELVLALGSDWHAYDSPRRAAVRAEAALLSVAHGRGMPVLGICYGAQLMAHAFGGEVHVADRIEVGWHLVESLDPAIVPGPWMQWHSDTFVPPPDALVLARSDVGPQAFRIGRSLAVQFHPEVDLQMVMTWVAAEKAEGGRALADAGLDGDDLIERTKAEAVLSEPRARALVRWFCGQL
jgi:GMP synthase-like glutamine amidotransferase